MCIYIYIHIQVTYGLKASCIRTWKNHSQNMCWKLPDTWESAPQTKRVKQPPAVGAASQVLRDTHMFRCSYLQTGIDQHLYLSETI